jgi:hypothetical protein
MAPLAGTFAANALEHGVAGLNVDGCRIAMGDEYDPTKMQRQQADSGGQIGRKGALKSWVGREVPIYKPGGRWPANVLLDEEAARALDEQSGIQKDGVAVQRNRDGGIHNKVYGARNRPPVDDQTYGGSGGASRFFYCAKSSKRERNSGGPNNHPTVKPLALCEYLARLILPPPREDGQPRRLLVPFAGSGSEMIGALRAGWDEVIGIELEEQYAAIADKRIQAYLSSSQQEVTHQ